MRRVAAFLLAFAAAGARAHPLAPPADLARLERGVVHSGIAARPDPTQTYDLYLPTAFDPVRRWPLLMVFDPRSRGKLAAEIFVPGAERFGWIVASSNNTRSDGPMEPNSRAVNAMFPDLMARLPVDDRRIYAGGFSGGAMVAWVVGARTGQLAGVISVGGRAVEGFADQPPDFALWAAAGRHDFNHHPTRSLDELAGRGLRAHRLEFFEGEHAWFSAEEASRALAWMEVVAMREGRRPADAALVERLLAEDLAGAEALLTTSHGLSALRRFRAVADTFRGLAEIAPIERRAEALEIDPAVRRELKGESEAAWFEQGARLRVGSAVDRLLHAEPVPPLARLEAELDLSLLSQYAAEGGPRADSARRVLAEVRAQFGFYLPRDFMASGAYARALPSLRIATRVAPDDATLWYNLACCEARRGRSAEALASLERALDLGFPRPTQLESDPDLASLRGQAAFARLVERARAAERP
jgi:tetratricopeptide (TPR) repeat protein